MINDAKIAIIHRKKGEKLSRKGGIIVHIQFLLLYYQILSKLKKPSPLHSGDGSIINFLLTIWYCYTNAKMVNLFRFEEAFLSQKGGIIGFV